MVKRKLEQPKVRKKVPSGATRTPARNVSNRKYLRSLLKVAAALGVVVLVVVKIDFKAQFDKVNAVANRPVAQISIEGEFKYISKEKVQKVLDAHVKQNFVDIDLEALKLGIEQNPWVETAAISRVWPDKLVVKITEQMPIAQWGDTAFINRFGDKVEVKDNSILSALPKLSGPDPLVKEIASSYLEISSLLGENGISLTGITVDETKSWIFWFPEQKALYVGRANIMEKLALFLMVFEQHLAGSLDKIKKVDMRYESGMAVEWVDNKVALADKTNKHQENYASN